MESLLTDFGDRPVQHRERLDCTYGHADLALLSQNLCKKKKSIVANCGIRVGAY